MAITAVVSNIAPRIIAKTNSSGALQSTTPVTLRNAAVITRLDQCLDVDASNEQHNSILVYNSVSDKYVVMPPNLSNIGASLDGGTF